MHLYSLLLLITSTIMAISSSNWIMIWMSMEMNLLSFIPLLFNTNSNNQQSVMLYFLTQALGSTIFIFTGTIYFLGMMNSMFMYMVLFSLFLKSGIAPCHFWLPIVMSKTSWFNCFILSTWQKIAPLFIMALLFSNNCNILKIIIPVNAIWGGIMGINQLQMKKIIAYSSITHMSWTLTGMFLNMPCLTILYFTIYSSMLMIIIFLLSNSSYLFYSDMWKKNMNTKMDFFICLSFLSLGGLPPLLGFFPKILLMFYLVPLHITMLIFMLIGSLLNLFFYLNISLNSFIKSMQTNTNMSSNKPYPFMVSMISMLSLLPMLLIIM